jgi:hypothetical protein
VRWDRTGRNEDGGLNSTAKEGNFLEAISLALAAFDKQYVDRDLTRTGQSIVVVTGGCGIFRVDLKFAQQIKQRMVDHGIGCDLVSLNSKPPLHVVPLFEDIHSVVSSPIPSSFPSTTTTSSSTSSLTGTNQLQSQNPAQTHSTSSSSASFISPNPNDLPTSGVTHFKLAPWIYLFFFDTKIHKEYNPKLNNSTFSPYCRMPPLQYRTGETFHFLLFITHSLIHSFHTHTLSLVSVCMYMSTLSQSEKSYVL